MGAGFGTMHTPEVMPTHEAGDLGRRRSDQNGSENAVEKNLGIVKTPRVKHMVDVIEFWESWK